MINRVTCIYNLQDTLPIVASYEVLIHGSLNVCYGGKDVLLCMHALILTQGMRCYILIPHTLSLRDTLCCCVRCWLLMFIVGDG